MWIFAQEGFYSIVKKPDGYHVRARRKQDLFNLGFTPVKSYAGSDYPWRVILPDKAELLKLMEQLGQSVDYPNFKSRVGQRPDQRHRLHAYQDIWGLMASEAPPQEG
jgi:hypothetical protein